MNDSISIGLHLNDAHLVLAGSVFKTALFGVFYLFVYLFNDNLATGGSLIGAILCHVEL